MQEEVTKVMLGSKGSKESLRDVDMNGTPNANSLRLTADQSAVVFDIPKLSSLELAVCEWCAGL